MIRRVYKARKGGAISQKDAEVIGPFLADKFGDRVVTPQAFVQASRSPRSAIHEYLTWDDQQAAHSYRVWEAREILASLEVVIETPDGPVQTRAYHNIIVENGDRHQAYAPQHVVWQSETLREQVINRALGELQRWEARYAHYEELASIAALISTAVEAAA